MNPKTDSKQAVRTASTLPVISGLRLTKQRQEVYQVLLEQRDHPTANEVYQRVRKKLPSISLATVTKNRIGNKGNQNPNCNHHLIH